MKSKLCIKTWVLEQLICPPMPRWCQRSNQPLGQAGFGAYRGQIVSTFPSAAMYPCAEADRTELPTPEVDRGLRGRFITVVCEDNKVEFQKHRAQWFLPFLQNGQSLLSSLLRRLFPNFQRASFHYFQPFPAGNVFMGKVLLPLLLINERNMIRTRKDKNCHAHTTQTLVI